MKSGLKVLHFTTSLGGGGAENMLANVVEAMSSNGVRNVVVTTTSSISGHSLRPRLEQCSVVYDLETTSLLKPRTLRSLWTVLKKEKPDVVQTWMHTSGVVAGLVAKLAGVRHVVWGIHSRDIICGRGETSGWRFGLTRRVLGLSSKLLPSLIISCSEVGIEAHRLHGYPPQRMVWIGNGIDTDRFKPSPQWRTIQREALGIAADAPVIGYVGRHHPVKDIPTLVRAAATIIGMRDDVHVVLCGPDREGASAEVLQCEAMVPDLNRLHWMGYQNAIHEVMPMFDLLTLTSTTEAYPMVLIEGMACGLPCVCTDVGDAKLILESEGMVVPVRSPLELVDAWQTILNLPPETYASMSLRARQRAESEYGICTCALRYQKVYQDLTAA